MTTPRADILTSVLKPLLEGRMDEAITELQREWPFLARSTSEKRFAVSKAEQLRVFTRDRFQCRYCGTRTVFLGALRLITILLPSHFPMHPFWDWSSTHPAYWELASSCDHVVPVARGGHNENNLVTSCYKCNAIKGHWLLEELQWKLRTPSTEAWDGLMSQFMAGMAKHSIENKWLKDWQKTIAKFHGNPLEA